MARTWTLEDLGVGGMYKLSQDPDIRMRIKHHWPLISPTDFSEWVKFDGKYIRFEDAKAIVEFCG